MALTDEELIHVKCIADLTELRGFIQGSYRMGRETDIYIVKIGTMIDYHNKQLALTQPQTDRAGFKPTKLEKGVKDETQER